MTIRKPLLAATLPLLAMLGSAFLWSQRPSASLHGTVTDVVGTAIPGAEVIARNLATQGEAKTRTDGQGHYTFANLMPGDYELRVQHRGFTTSLTRVSLSAGARLERSFALGSGTMAENVAAMDAAAPKHRMERRAPGVLGGVISMAVPHAPMPLPGRMPPGHDTEEYGTINEDGFAEVARRPLSTFSIDVDTAAYTQVRRFLREGKLPPADAVRIEEMLNYFRYAYPDPKDGHPFSITTEMAACPWNPGHRIVQVGLKSRAIQAESLPAANLTFLIDVSGSMMPANKLPLLKKSFGLLVDQLRPQDRVAIVVYAGAAGLVLPSTPGSEKERIRAALERLEAGGSTAGAAGIRLAYQSARQHFLKGGNNRVILATDGDFNVGTSSDGELQRLIETEREHGVFLTVLGYGMGNVKDSKMEMLARHGNGNYAYIDSILEARRVLVEQLGATLLTVAKDVKLQVEFNPAHVRAYRLIGYENRRLRDEEFKDDTKDAGELGAGHSVTALYEVVPAGSGERLPGVDPLKYQKAAPSGGHGQEVLTVKLRYKPPTAAVSTEFATVLENRVTAPGENLRFAMAVTEFGLLLRDSKHKGLASFDHVMRQAEGALGRDEDGRRAEFLYLVKQARALKPVETARRD